MLLIIICVLVVAGAGSAVALGSYFFASDYQAKHIKRG
jgi:flagellar basal body-associated protein FliL